MERIIPHPLYSTQNHDYDIALLRLQTPLNFSGEALARGEQAVGCGERGLPWGRGWGLRSQLISEVPSQCRNP